MTPHEDDCIRQNDLEPAEVEGRRCRRYGLSLQGLRIIRHNDFCSMKLISDAVSSRSTLLPWRDGQGHSKVPNPH